MVERHVRRVLMAMSMIFSVILLTGLVMGSSVAYAHDPRPSPAIASYAQAATSALGFDFTISNSGNVTAESNGAGSTTINVTLASGQPESVSLSCSEGLPTGAMCIFNPSSGLPSFASTLIIITRSTQGSYTITVTGSGGGVTHTTMFTLRVNPQGTVRLAGSVLPIDLLRLLAPYIVVAAAAAASALAYLGFGRRRKR